MKRDFNYLVSIPAFICVFLSGILTPYKTLDVLTTNYYLVVGYYIFPFVLFYVVMTFDYFKKKDSDNQLYLKELGISWLLVLGVLVVLLLK